MTTLHSGMVNEYNANVFKIQSSLLNIKIAFVNGLDLNKTISVKQEAGVTLTTKVKDHLEDIGISASSKEKVQEELQSKLHIRVDGFYGEKTKEAVKAWEIFEIIRGTSSIAKAKNVTADGKIDENEFQHLTENISSNTIIGNGFSYDAKTQAPIESEALKEQTQDLQTKLKEKYSGIESCENLSADGSYEGQTEACVKDVQNNSGFFPDGIVGPFTQGVINY